METSDKVFAGSIPEFYDRFLVPLIFESYALDVARRVAQTNAHNILEIAAGTGVLTRAMISLLPKDVQITATDLNQSMLDHARSKHESGAGLNGDRPMP
jgi:ubiquinone/menaquinone biosynthesis C-methylase UbiE